MYTTIAYWGEAATVLSPIDAVADEHVTVSGDDVTIPIGLDHVVAVQATGPALNRAYLSSPSLRRIWLEELVPFASASDSIPDGAIIGLINRQADPVPLTASEKLNFYSTCAAAPSAGVVFLGDGPIEPVHGDIRTIMATADIEDVEDSWKSGVLDFDQTLPAGRYQVVGFRCVDGYGIAARLLFVGQWHRPGTVCANDRMSINDTPFRFGRFGIMGEFEFDQPPQMEILAKGTGTSQEVFLDLIQIRAGRS